MADITPRKMQFAFRDRLDPDLPPPILRELISGLAFSFTMPYLEPYLIRTMRAAMEGVDDPQLLEDMRRFSQQEGHHYRNHAVLNQRVREQLSPETADRVQALEDALEADYQRFTKTKSLRFNAGYAEGFEVMTCSMVLAGFDRGMFDETLPDSMEGTIVDLTEWHWAEEVEHRTVAFDVFEAVCGNYPYRILMGWWTQIHYLSYIQRLYKAMCRGLGLSARGIYVPSLVRKSGRRYLKTLSPWYDPAKVYVPPQVERLLAKYSALIEAA